MKGIQIYRCPKGIQISPENINTLYCNRHLNREEVQAILQSYAEGSSFRGVSRISGKAYVTVVSLIRDMDSSLTTHNTIAQSIIAEAFITQEMYSFVCTNKKTVR